MPTAFLQASEDMSPPMEGEIVGFPTDEDYQAEKDEDALRIKVDAYYEGAVNYQYPRWQDWRENYQLYRDKVVVNRFTQRQSVNVPLTKETIKTILANTDDKPDVRFGIEVPETDSFEGIRDQMDQNRMKEIFMNDYWMDTYKRCKLEIKDIVDKKQVLLYGRSFKKINLTNGYVTIDVIDPADIVVDRYCDPADLDSANYMAHTRIYRTIGEIENNPNYDEDAIYEIKAFYATVMGLIKQEETRRNMAQMSEKLSDMGDFDARDPHLGETYVELREHYVKVYDEEKVKEAKCEDDGFAIYVVVTCDQETLLAKPLKEILGVNFFPFTSWADDVEKTHFWSDGTGDICRTPNKIVNSWFAQLTENRTLRNFGMNYYNASDDQFVPQTFTPEPWGWYPIPGNPNDMIKRVEVPALSESLQEMQFTIDMVQRATAASATLKGETAGSRTTLGEIEIVSKAALKTITAMSKFYRQAWEETACKWSKVVMANIDQLEEVKFYKKSASGSLFAKTFAPMDYKHDGDFHVTVTTSAEQENDAIDAINKYKGVAMEMLGNPIIELAKKRKMIALLDLSPEEERSALDFEQNRSQNPQQGQPQMPQQTPTATPMASPAMAMAQ